MALLQDSLHTEGSPQQKLIVYEEEEEVCDKALVYLKEIGKFQSKLNDLNEAIPKCVEAVANKKHQKIEDTKTKINDLFDNITTALKRKRHELLNELQQIANELNDNNDAKDEPCNGSDDLANTINGTLNESRSYLQSKLDWCQQQIHDPQGNNKNYRKQRKINIVALGAEIECHFMETKAIINDNMQKMEGMVDKYESFTPKIDCVYSQLAYDSMLSSIDSFGEIMHETINSEPSPLINDPVQPLPFTDPTVVVDSKTMAVFERKPYSNFLAEIIFVLCYLWSEYINYAPGHTYCNCHSKPADGDFYVSVSAIVFIALHLYQPIFEISIPDTCSGKMVAFVIIIMIFFVQSCLVFVAAIIDLRVTNSESSRSNTWQFVISITKLLFIVVVINKSRYLNSSISSIQTLCRWMLIVMMCYEISLEMNCTNLCKEDIFASLQSQVQSPIMWFYGWYIINCWTVHTTYRPGKQKAK
eukprot:343428_1